MLCRCQIISFKVTRFWVNLKFGLMVGSYIGLMYWSQNVLEDILENVLEIIA